MSFFCLAQAQIVEDFSDGNFSDNPTWSGDDTKFTIDQNQLRSNSTTASDIFYLSTPSRASIDAEWRCYVHMNFSTSGANYTDVYLMSDSANLTKTHNGYFVRIGDTKDNISLYKIIDGTTSQLTSGTESITHNKQINLRVTRSSIGQWNVYADYNGGLDYTLEGAVTDNEVLKSLFFGFYIKQSTPTFHQKHFYDNIYVGPIQVDKTAPLILSTTTSDPNIIVLTCNEAVDISSATFLLDNGYGAPDNAVVNNEEVTLTYNTPLANNSYVLSIAGLEDLNGNTLDTTVSFTFYQASTPTAEQLLITEIFADPTPSIGLPEEEYIEIYNHSNEALQLENCTFSDGGTPAVFPEYILPPKAYVIVVSSGNGSLFLSYGSTLELARFPALNNGGDALEIRNANGELLDAVTYNNDYYHDDIKEQGGYALERIEMESECPAIENWTASYASIGGTPGTENSVFGQNPDQDAPQLRYGDILSETEVVLHFSENSIASLATSPANYLLNEITIPLSATQNEYEQTVVLKFSDPIAINAKHTITIKSIEDCKGNAASDILLELVYTEAAAPKDIVINEVLFNAKSGGEDFVELYNNSDKYIDLSSLSVRYTNGSGNASLKKISASTVLYPHSYVAITSDTISLKEFYPLAQNMIELESFVSMNNDGGSLSLIDKNLTLIDTVVFSEDCHFGLLRDVDGVSLERVSFTTEGTHPQNWQSASSTVGFATPGYQNSQSVSTAEQDKMYSLASKTMSPDNDGFEDVLAISYQTAQTGTVLNGYVYNLAGRLVHHAFKSETLGTQGILTWDGITSNGTKVPIGNYILLLESFTLDGKVTRKKIAFSVTGMF